MFELKRRPKTVSFSSMSLFEKDRDEFYIKYLACFRAARLPQTDYMCVGSAFDAYVKSDLHAALFGAGTDTRFEFDAIFEEQVEEHNRDFGREAGAYVFSAYKQSGFYDELLALLKQSIEPPQFETTVEGVVDGVPLLGKPDCRFVLPGPVRVILDWKVKGYCSKYGASPSKGYRLCRDGYLGKQSRSHNTAHKLYLAMDHRGLEISAGSAESGNDEYAAQVTLYSWLLGEKPGDENMVVWIDEIVAKYMGEGNMPLLRVANHRARVTKAYQLKLLERAKTCWNAITTGHIFGDLSREDNDSRCEILEEMSKGLQTDGSPLEAFFNECTRPQFTH